MYGAARTVGMSLITGLAFSLLEFDKVISSCPVGGVMSTTLLDIQALVCLPRPIFKIFLRRDTFTAFRNYPEVAPFFVANN